MVDMMKDLTENNIPCYSDFHVAGINCDKIVPGQLPVDYPDDPHYLAAFSDIKERDFPKGSVLFLDELIKEFDNRLTMGKVEETKYRSRLTQSFMQIGKKHLRVVHAEQITRTIDWRIAYLSEMFLVPRPTAYKIVDQEVINVEFDVTPVINEGIFGFREMPHYYMDEERFWYYAFEYDSDEPVLSEDEKLEAREKKRKEEIKKKEYENHAKKEKKRATAQSLRAQLGQLEGETEKERLKKYAEDHPIPMHLLPIEKPFEKSEDNDPDSADDQERSDNAEPDKNSIKGNFGIGNRIQNYAQNDKPIRAGHGQPTREFKSFSQVQPVANFKNNISEAQFYDWLGSMVRAN